MFFIYFKIKKTCLKILVGTHKFGFMSDVGQIDIEGQEFKILNFSSITAIKKCHVIIEIHHWIDNFTNEYQKLLKILLKYFTIKFITHTNGSIEINKFKELNGFTDDNRCLICSEHRPSQMRYLYCIPKYL